MKLKLLVTFLLCFFALLILFGSHHATFAQSLAEASVYATLSDDCVIPPSGPWPPCATQGDPPPSDLSAGCVIPPSGPWPTCATQGDPPPPNLPVGCVIPPSGPWPLCAVNVTAPPPSPSSGSLPADECVIPPSGSWPECDRMTVRIDNSGSHQYRVAWRGNNPNVSVKMVVQIVTIDGDTGQEKPARYVHGIVTGRAESVELVALTPFAGRLIENRTVTFQLEDAAKRVIAEQELPLVRPSILPTVNQFIEVGPANNRTVIWDVSTDVRRSNLHLQINRATGSEQVIFLPLRGQRQIVGEYESIDLIVNGWVVGTLR